MSRRFFAAHRSPSWLVALAGLLAVALVAPAHGGERRNIHGMHTLMDGGAFVSEGMNWTRHMVGEGGYVFDWVRGDHGKWVVEAMDRGLIPCLRIQECNGGCIPSPGYPAIVVSVIREHLAEHRPQYQNRLIYVQLWNEPGDPRDFVTPEDFADYLVQAHHAVKQADIEGVFRTMTPGQNGSEWWRRAIRHNPAVCQAFDVWASHPYPESYPPHYNHHDGVPYINQVKTIDSYLPDLDAVADECQKQGSPRRGFPVMITETVYGDHLGIAYEGYPKTTRGAACTTDGPCDFKMAAEYNVAAFTEFWHKWPEIIAVHPFILNNWSWDYFAFVSRMSGSRNDGPVPSWCPTEDVAGGVPWPPGYSEGAQRCGLPTAPYPQYRALLDLPKSPPASLEPYRGPVGSIRGFVRRADTADPVAHATVSTDDYEFGGPSLFDGQYVVRNVPIGSYTLRAEKVGYGSASVPVTVEDGVEAVVDFDLVYRGKVSKGLYFQNQGTCSGCNLFAPFLGQTLQVPPDVGFIKFAAAMPNVGNLTVELSILEGGPTGPQLGPSTTAFLEWGGEMIGAEWPGDGVPVTPGSQIFLKVERADGQGLYCYGTDSDPYPDGMVYTGTTAHPGWDLFATVRGLTVAVDAALGTLSGRVEDVLGAPVGGAEIRTAPGSHATLTGSDGRYVFAALAEGTYDVTASRGGFLPQTRSGVTVLEGQTTSVDFSLTEDVSLGTLAGGVSDDAGILLMGAAVLVSPGGHATREENFFGKAPHLEPAADRWEHVIIASLAGDPKLSSYSYESIGAGLAAVWARENTREGLFDAMQKREVYATTGTRILVRFVGGWDYGKDEVFRPEAVSIGYRKGVPMGGDLPEQPSSKRAPVFMVGALKDTWSGSLDRVQIIKGWIDDKGDRQERVYDVAVSDGRTIASDGRCRTPVGNTVDVADASYLNNIGDAELRAVWTDPDFNPKHRAFYYARVLEIPDPHLAGLRFEALRGHDARHGADVRSGAGLHLAHLVHALRVAVLRWRPRAL